MTGDKPGFLDWCALTEDTLVENFHRVFGGNHCKVFAQLMYIYLSNRQDCVQINYVRFLQAFTPVLSEYAEVRGEVPFRLLDVDGDGKINILNILQIHHHLGPRGNKSPFSVELRRIYREYKDRNLHMRDGYKYQVQLNESTFQKLVPNSCLIDELRLRIFGAIPATQSIFPQYVSPFENVEDFYIKQLECKGLEGKEILIDTEREMLSSS